MYYRKSPEEQMPSDDLATLVVAKTENSVKPISPLIEYTIFSMRKDGKNWAYLALRKEEEQDI